MRIKGIAISVLISCASLAPGAAPIQVVTTLDDIADKITVIDLERKPLIWGSTLYDESAVLPLGDLNGDGKNDLLFVADWGRDSDSESTAYVLFGSETLPRKLSPSADWPARGLRFHSVLGGRFAAPAAALGDVDGDGASDVAFMQSGQLPLPALLLFGAPDLPRDIDTSDLSELRGCTLLPDPTLAGLTPGFFAFAGGDVNGDGIGDLILGSRLASIPGRLSFEGVVYVVFGTLPWPETIDVTKLGTELQGCRLTAHCANSQTCGDGLTFGDAVRSGCDFNADGYDELLINVHKGLLSFEGRQAKGGTVFVIFGRKEWTTELDLMDGPADGVCRIYSFQDVGCLGTQALMGIDDVTGDDVPDLVISGGPGFISHYLISGATLAAGDYQVEELAVTAFGTALYPPLSGSVAEVGDWNGDGRNECAFGRQNDETFMPIPGFSSNGAVVLAYGSDAHANPFYVDGGSGVTAKILGPVPRSTFGSRVIACDISGDARPELAVLAAGFPQDGLPENYTRRIYIIPSDVDLRGPLTGTAFSPNSSPLAGGSLFNVWGSGFDATTSVFLGTIQLEVLDRPNSRRLTARLPAVAEPGSYVVRILRGDAEYAFADEFAYYESVLPRELDVRDLGSAGSTLAFSDCTSDDLWGAECGKDVTGDGLGDILVLRDYPPSVILLHGARDLPPRIAMPDALPTWATVFVKDPLALYERGAFGVDAIAPGDMDGDGVSELAITEPLAKRVYIIRGGEFPKGFVLIDDLIAQGRCVVIEDCAYSLSIHVTYSLRKAGDVNGDHLADLGIQTLNLEDERHDVTSSALALILGTRQPPQTRHYEELPKLYGLREAQRQSIGVVDCGDLDGDGFEDMVAGASAWGPGAPSISICGVFFGRAEFAARTMLEDEIENGGACGITTGGGVYDIGDVNGDGAPDLGFHFGNSDGVQLLRIVYGGSREHLCRPRSSGVDADFDVTFRTTPGYNAFIREMTGGGDFNADGYGDILLCDDHNPYDDMPPPSRAICIFGGNLEEEAGPLSMVRGRFELVNGGRAVGNEEYVRYPTDFEFAGDVNGDGYEDLVTYDFCHVYIYFNPLGALKGAFVRGDANQDSRIDIADAISVLSYLFGGARALSCMDAGDANDDEVVNIADAVKILGHLFGDAGPLPQPSQCGPDPQGDTLGCADSACK